VGRGVPAAASPASGFIADPRWVSELDKFTVALLPPDLTAFPLGPLRPKLCTLRDENRDPTLERHPKGPQAGHLGPQPLGVTAVLGPCGSEQAYVARFEPRAQGSGVQLLCEI
jgi:hypothetical protein